MAFSLAQKRNLFQARKYIGIKENCYGVNLLQRKRAIYLLADVYIVLTIAVFCFLMFVAVADHTTRAKKALLVGKEARAMTRDQIALPFSLRAGVQDLLDLEVTPVLFQEDVTPLQYFSVIGVDTVASFNAKKFERIAKLSYEISDLTFSLIDLQIAAKTPLEQGEVIDINFSRPYRYTPLAASVQLKSVEEHGYTFFLDAGTYVLGFEALSFSRKTIVVVEVTKFDGSSTVELGRVQLSRVSQRAEEFLFVQEDRVPGKYLFRIRAEDDAAEQNEAAARVHRIYLRKL